MLWYRIPFLFWPAVVRYYFLRVFAVKPSPILSNWIYFLRLSLPLGFTIKKHEKDYLINDPGRKLNVVLRPNTSDILVFNQIFFKGEYKLLNSVQLSQYPVIVDLGANVGLFMCYAKTRWPGATIIGVEPDGGNYLQTKKQNKLNKFMHSEVLQAGVWIRNEKLSLLNPDKILEWSFQVEENVEGEIEGVTLASIIQKFRIERIDLLKIDIEGTEVKLFAEVEFLQTLQSYVQNLIMETHDPEDQKQIAAMLDTYGFQVTYDRELIFAKNIAL